MPTHDSATNRARAEEGKKMKMPDGAGREIMHPRPVVDAMVKHIPRQTGVNVKSNR